MGLDLFVLFFLYDLGVKSTEVDGSINYTSVYASKTGESVQKSDHDYAMDDIYGNCNYDPI